MILANQRPNQTFPDIFESLRTSLLRILVALPNGKFKFYSHTSPSFSTECLPIKPIGSWALKLA